MNKGKILYLEDDGDLGEITADFLTREGYAVQWVTNGATALEIFNENKFDIIIADIMMPQLDGYSFLKIIREKGNQIPFIYLSARVLTEDILQGFAIGADDYIRKPCSLEELIARIRRLLKGSAEQEISEQLLIGDYRYHPNNYQLIYKETTVILSHRSGEILRRFMESEDGILKRRDVLLDLWGDDHFFNGRSLDVFISKLRKQLSQDPKIKIINIRAVGYRLVITH